MPVQYTAIKANPVASFRFSVLFNGSNGGSLFADAGFSRVTGLEFSAEVIRYREGGQIASPRKFPGMTDYPALRFERGCGTNMDMYVWAGQAYVVNPDSTPLPETYDTTGYRRSLTINGYDNSFSTTVRSWAVVSAWPSAVSMGDFDAMSSTVLIESMTVQHEGIHDASGQQGSVAQLISGIPDVY